MEEYCDGAPGESLGIGGLYERQQWHARCRARRESCDRPRSGRVPVGVGVPGIASSLASLVGAAIPQFMAITPTADRISN